MPEGSIENIHRNIDWEANVLFMLAFLSVGDGGTEAGHALGLLGLPNTTTFGPRSFGNIEAFIGPVLTKFADKLVHEHNLSAEVQVVLGDKKDDAGNGLFDSWKNGLLPQESWPRLTTSGDMGWQGRSSGKSYNSLSGDAMLVGQHTRKPVAWHVMGKACSFCQGWNRGKKGKNGDPVPQHDCRADWDGSSGAMEPVATLNVVVLLFRSFNVVVEHIIADDDSSTKAKMKWNNANTVINNNLDEPPFVHNDKGDKVVRPDKGELPADIPEPSFLADPNHRKKSLANVLHQLEGKKASTKFTMTKMDVLRLATNFAYMVRTLPQQSEDNCVTCGKAVLDHHFDDHTHCGDWCSRKNLSNEEKQQSTKHCRDKERDAKLYEELHDRIERFVTKEALLEVAHGMDTQCNESFNNVVAWIAPKNKACSKSNSLKHRIAFALGVNALGVLSFYQELFLLLGIAMTSSVLHCVAAMNSYRVNKLNKQKTSEGKKRRAESHQRKLLMKTVLAKREKHRREGQHQPGVGMAAGHTAEELAMSAQLFPGRRRKEPDNDNNKGKKKDPAMMLCKTCLELGHGLVTSKKCKHNDDYKAWKATNPPKGAKHKPPTDDSNQEQLDNHSIDDSPEAQTARDRGDCDLLDSLPLVDDDDDDGMDLFFDAFDIMPPPDDDVVIDHPDSNKEN